MKDDAKSVQAARAIAAGSADGGAAAVGGACFEQPAIAKTMAATVAALPAVRDECLFLTVMITSLMVIRIHVTHRDTAAATLPVRTKSTQATRRLLSPLRPGQHPD